jgi:hypothetical protein
MGSMKFVKHSRTRLSSIKWHSGKSSVHDRSDISVFVRSDDEGSDEEEEGDDEEEEDYQEVEDEEGESSSCFFDTNSHEQQNGGQSAPSTSFKPEGVSGLSNMIAQFDFNTNSSFNFGQQANNTVMTNRSSCTNLDLF